MNDNLIRIIEKILENPKLTRAFLKFENLNDMYYFLQRFDDGFTIEELQHFINELINALHFSSVQLEENELNLVAGGKNIMNNFKRFAETSLATLSLLNPIANAAFATESNTSKTSTFVNQKITSEKNSVKEIAKKIATYVFGGVAVVGGTVAVGGLIYLGYNYFADAKFPIIFAANTRRMPEDEKLELQNTINKYKKERKDFLLITQSSKSNQKYKVEHFTPENYSPSEIIVAGTDVDEILMTAFCRIGREIGYIPGFTVKPGVYSGNEKAFNQIAALQLIP
ncbi:MAG: hypothetical protein LBR79_05730 [Oscillospiraceae bacterium]|jgi:hypothetical protein|nr:hypothetical protein [Oscillospiraceae bacterium]